MYSDFEEKHEEARYWFFVAVIFFALSFSVVAGVNAVVKPDMQGNPEIQFKVYAEYVAEIAGVDLYHDSDIDRPPPNPTTYEDVVRSLLLSSDEMQYRFSPDYIKIAKGFNDDMAQMFLDKLEAFDMKSTTQRTVHLDHVAGLDEINVRLMDAYKKLMETSMVGDKLRDLTLKVMAGSIINQLINSSRTLMPELMGGTMFWRWIENGDLPFNFIFLHDIEGDMSIGVDTVTDVGMVVPFTGNKTADAQAMDQALIDYYGFFADNPLLSGLYTHCWIVGLDPSNPNGDVNVTQTGSVIETQMMKLGTALSLEERYGDDFGMLSEYATSDDEDYSGNDPWVGGLYNRDDKPSFLSAITQRFDGAAGAFAGTINYRDRFASLSKESISKLVDMEIYYTLNDKDNAFLTRTLVDSFGWEKNPDGTFKLDGGDTQLTGKAKIPFWAAVALAGGRLLGETGKTDAKYPYKEFMSYLVAYPALLLMNNPKTLKQALTKHYGSSEEAEKDKKKPPAFTVPESDNTDTGGEDDDKTVCFWNLIGLFMPPTFDKAWEEESAWSQGGDPWYNTIENVMVTTQLGKRGAGNDQVVRVNFMSMATGQHAKQFGVSQAIDFFVAKKSAKNEVVKQALRILIGEQTLEAGNPNAYSDYQIQDQTKKNLPVMADITKNIDAGLDAVALKSYKLWYPGHTYSGFGNEAPYYPLERLEKDEDGKPSLEEIKALSDRDRSFPNLHDQNYDTSWHPEDALDPSPLQSTGVTYRYQGDESWRGSLAMAVHDNIFDYWNEFIPYAYQQRLAHNRGVYVIYGRPMLASPGGTTTNVFSPVQTGDQGREFGQMRSSTRADEVVNIRCWNRRGALLDQTININGRSTPWYVSGDPDKTLAEMIEIGALPEDEEDRRELGLGIGHSNIFIPFSLDVSRYKKPRVSTQAYFGSVSGGNDMREPYYKYYGYKSTWLFRY